MTVKRIVLIDDDLVFSTVFLRKLECCLFKDQRVDITHYSSSEEAIDCIHKDQPEIIFLDHFMSGVNGIDALPFLKRILPNSEFVLLSGCDRAELRNRATEAGAVGFFLKDALLLNKIEDFIREIAKNPSQYSTLGSNMIH